MAANSSIPTLDPQAIRAAALANTPAATDAPGVDKIRELLFGNQMQDYDRRFSVLEERFHLKLRDQEAEFARSLVEIAFFEIPVRVLPLRKIARHFQIERDGNERPFAPGIGGSGAARQEQTATEGRGRGEKITAGPAG